MAHQHRIRFDTAGHGHMTDLTGRVVEIVSNSGIDSGLANVFNVGSTGAVGTIEFEPGLAGDLPATSKLGQALLAVAGLQS